MVIMNIYFLFILSNLMFFLSIYFSLNKLTFVLEWILMELNSMNLEFLIYIDWMSLMFMGLVMFISSFVLLYSLVYMEMDLNIKRFFILVLLFILSMIFLIICPNIMGLLLGWDGLGLISYCLVIYYQNWKSFNSGMVTVLLNRIGDVGILMSICLFMMVGSWNGLFYDLKSFLVTVLLMLSALTKSAQLPFSVWLPMAMAAPTPVSSLVHSSTLVTAGVYLLIRYNYYLIVNNCFEFLLWISSMTMLMSGFLANYENDLKKIIALSTLSQLGLMMSILSMGNVDLSYFHLIIHALFKSLLFMCSGILIHLLNNNQDIRYMGNLIKNYPYVSLVFFVSTLSLCGFPFFSGFYSKDLIMEYFLMSHLNSFSLVMLLLATMFTVSYSFRLIIIVYFGYSNKFNSLYILKENKLMSFSLMFLCFDALFIGSNLMNMFSMEIIILTPFEKLLILNLCFIGLFLGLYYGLNAEYLDEKYRSNFLFYVLKMWGLGMFYENINLVPLKSSELFFKTFDKGVLEFSFIYGLNLNFLKIFLKYLSFNFFFYFCLLSMFFLTLFIFMM